MEIKLNKYNSKYSVNREGNKNIPLISKFRITPYTDLNERIDLNNLYTQERDNCKNYRLIFTINPICSNILFNMRTEVVKNEGDYNPTVIIGDNALNPRKIKAINTSIIDIKQCIKDTEYSHSQCGGFTYHCGMDIFNNHRLRSLDFTHVNKVKSDDGETFNTISDFIRNENGEIVSELLPYKNLTDTELSPTKLHLYQTDNILSMGEAYEKKLSEVNGWLGFTNPTSIEIPIINHNNSEIILNKLLNNRKACEFIDMYPDRSLFSFIPKLNTYKRRLENNWDYIITYPHSNDYQHFNKVNDNHGCGGIKVIESFISHTNNGMEMISLRTLIKHNLKKGDYVRLYYLDNENINGVVTRFYKKVKVNRIGDSEGKYVETLLSIKMDDLGDIAELINERGIENLYFFIRKEVNDCECDYYFRKFKEIRNFNNERLNSEVNKLAYGENIYGDRVAQIIFNDTINIESLRDNLNRPLHELFLTIIKRNAGREEWYTYNNFNSENIEYSHCFGKVTAGLDLKHYLNNKNILSSYKDYNVHRLHNINLNTIDNEYINLTKKIYTNFIDKPSVIEGDDSRGIVLLNEGMELYGDIVEFNHVKYTETTLEHIFYRFNTEQRETSNKYYYDIFTDDIISDDYDLPIETNNNNKQDGVFKVEETLLNVVEGEKYAGNLQPEGYYYKAHNKIIIAEVDDVIKSSEAIIINVQNINVNVINSEYDVVTFTSPVDYGFESGHIISFYDVETKKLTFGTLDRCDENLTVKVVVESMEISSKQKYIISLCKDGCPTYASFIPSSKLYVWREVLPMSALSNDSELYNTPFTNNAHYIHTNINLFLKRQDPVGNYFMFSPEDDKENEPEVANPLKNYRRYGWSEIDLSAAEFIENEIDNSCY